MLENLRAVLAADGLDLDAIVRTTVYLTDLADFPRVNQIYAEFFTEPFPARADGAGGRAAARRPHRDRRHSLAKR